MNKNISVWRGILPPPTRSHIWIKNDEAMFIYRNGHWEPLYDEASEEKSGFMSKTDKQILNMLNENLHWN